MNKKLNFLKKIWSDPVFSKVIANAIWIIPSTIFGVIQFNQRAKEILLFNVPIIIPVLLLIFMLFLLSIIIQFYAKKNKEILKQKNAIENTYNEQRENIDTLMKNYGVVNFNDFLLQIKLRNDEYVSLKKQVGEYNNKPYSPRYELFNIGDIVKMRSAEPYAREEYTIINKKNNCIYAVDKKNKEVEFSPEALSTTLEHENEQKEHDKMINNFFNS